jgi:hypothetical protein
VQVPAPEHVVHAVVVGDEKGPALGVVKHPLTLITNYDRVRT